MYKQTYLSFFPSFMTSSFLDSNVQSVVCRFAFACAADMQPDAISFNDWTVSTATWHAIECDILGHAVGGVAQPHLLAAISATRWVRDSHGREMAFGTLLQKLLVHNTFFHTYSFMNE